MEPTTNPTLPPTYHQLLQEMGRQIGQRKSALMKRVLLITWPYLLLVVVGYISKNTFNLKALAPDAQVEIVTVIAVYFVLALAYTMVISFIFQIEKQIWVDSFFDQKPLSLQQSWRIARKLFWPAFNFRVKLWFHYFGIPFIIVLAAIVAFFWVLITGAFGDQLVMIWLVGFFGVMVGIVFYKYFLRIKLRYSWFIFLDKFGNTDSYDVMINEMNTLNQISKSETFKKSLIANLGTDSINSLVQMAVGTISMGFAQFGEVGKAVGQVLNIYGKEMSRQTTDLANISAQYILYRFARKEAFGQEQEVNNTLYNLE
jgi:hypothetical protein